MIPEWNMQGVLPPLRPGSMGHEQDRSPYHVPLASVVERFAKTQERIQIIEGFLNYRQALYDVGIDSGFQWLDGSFMEQIEQLESRPPNDVDVVTFFHLPPGTDQQQLAQEHRNLFLTKETKSRFHVDGYPFILGGPIASHDIKLISYWYSMWSHRRSGLWKGFVQVDLSPNEDASALAALALIQQEGAQP